MCTVVCRWRPNEDFAVQMLALRDELASRRFDLPRAWWPDQPGVIGGRDRLAGGSWCVSDIAAGVSAVVLNRPERRVATAGAPSRGVLPLLAVRHGERWPDFVQLAGMASFNLVLATPRSLHWWWFDGETLHDQELAGGTYLFKPAGLVSSGLDPRLAGEGAHLDADLNAAIDDVWPQWLAAVHDSVPTAGPSGLIVRRPVGDDSYETVFGQFIAARPGLLRLDYLRNPVDGTDREWTTELHR